MQEKILQCLGTIDKTCNLITKAKQNFPADFLQGRIVVDIEDAFRTGWRGNLGT